MPLGIPDRNIFKSIPGDVNSSWNGNIQVHKAKRAGLHYDLRLNPPGTSDALSWAIRNLPEPGQKTLAVEQPTHESSYMGFEGEIGPGYGEGSVSNLFLDKVEILESKPDKILFNMYRGQSVDRYMLMRTGAKDWLLYNYTGTAQETEKVPDYKSHYKSIKLNELRTDYRNEVWSPKLDGGHNTVLIRPNKRLDVYSYRTSLKTGRPIDHSYITDLYKIRGPVDLGNTIVRTELYIPGKDSSIVGGILNSNVWKSRENQEQGGKLKPAMFDIIRFKNKFVEDRPYSEKLEMMKEVTSKIPELELPPLAYTQQEKMLLKDKIISGKHPLTNEGIIVYKMDESVPYKSKQTEDYDVLIKGIFSASPGSKYEGNAIGGFLGTPENSKAEVRIGSGISDELRREAYLNPNKFIGSWIKVKGQMKYDRSGKIRMPIFQEFRIEKYK